MDWLIAIIEGVVAALCASFISLAGLQFFRPKLRIVPFISANYSEELQSLRFTIKIVNQSRRRLVEPRLELVLVYRNKDGIEKDKLIERERADPMSIAGHRPKDDAGKTSGTYSATYSDLSRLISERVHGSIGGVKLRFRIYAKDEWTGIGRLFHITFTDLPSQIIYGRFVSGDSDNISAKEPHPSWLKMEEIFSREESAETEPQESPVPSPRNAAAPGDD